MILNEPESDNYTDTTDKNDLESYYSKRDNPLHESNQNNKSNEINREPNDNPNDPKSANEGIIYNQSLM